MSGLVEAWFHWTTWVVLGYALVLNTQYLVLALAAASTITTGHRREDVAGYEDLFASPLTPAVSVVLPAHDEERGIVDSVEAVFAVRYPSIEVVAVDDGSTDETFARLADHFDLEAVPVVARRGIEIRGPVQATYVSRTRPLTVVRKTSIGSKADALNAGLAVASHELVCLVDADGVLEEDALLRLVKPFVDDPHRVIASGGSVRAVNGSVVHRGRLAEPSLPRPWLVRVQIVEYLRAFLVGRTGWGRFGALTIISGAFGLFRREAVEAVGGLDADAIGEDLDLVVRLHRYHRDRGIDYSIAFVPDASCWTEVPEHLRDLRSQRRRWSRGLAQVLWTQRAMIGRPRYGRVGLFALPHLVAFELLGPIVELMGLVAVLVGVPLGLVDLPMALLIAGAALGYGVTLSVAALAIEDLTFHRHDGRGSRSALLAAMVLETVGFRQLHSWWRLRGLASFVRGGEFTWEPLARAGFDAEPADPAVGARPTGRRSSSARDEVATPS